MTIIHKLLFYNQTFLSSDIALQSIRSKENEKVYTFAVYFIVPPSKLGVIITLKAEYRCAILHVPSILGLIFTYLTTYTLGSWLTCS